MMTENLCCGINDMTSQTKRIIEKTILIQQYFYCILNTFYTTVREKKNSNCFSSALTSQQSTQDLYDKMCRDLSLPASKQAIIQPTPACCPPFVF